MPRPQIIPPEGANLASIILGFVDLFSATKQWQLETNRDELGASDLIFPFDVEPDWLAAKGLPPSCIPVPSMVINRAYALPYMHGRGPDNPDATEEHRNGAVMVDILLPVNEDLDIYDQKFDVVGRMEMIIYQARALRDTPRRADPSRQHTRFTGFKIFHGNDGQSGEPAPVQDRTGGEGWDFRNWSGEALNSTPWVSTWVLHFGY